MAERLDDLQCNGYRILQDTEGFCFGMDAVLLAAYAASSGSIGEESRVLDLCAGNGIIPLLLAAKTACKYIHAIEIQESAVSLARRSILLNHAEGRICMAEGDVREIRSFYGSGSMDIVTANPPYLKNGLPSQKDNKLLARHEILLPFSELALAVSYVLRTRGRFFLVHRPQRMVEILSELSRCGLEPKRLRLIHSYLGSEAKLFLLEAVKGGKGELRVEAPLVVYQDKQRYTEEILRIYAACDP